MPDPTKATVSASQMPAIFNLSPYATRFMMYHVFANGFDTEPDENDRMNWGKRLEPAILKAAADELRCDVLPHPQAEYLRHPDLPIGCTPDGYVFDPQRGLGFVECKNVDWMRWRDTWDDSAAAPHVELQLQTQLMVPHPALGLPQWGCIASLIGGNDLKLYERKPIPAVHKSITEETGSFLGEVANRIEPEVAGRAIEIPALIFAHPRAESKKTLTEEHFETPRAVELARMIDLYAELKDRESTSKKDAEQLKAKLLGAAGDAWALSIFGRFLDINRISVEARTQSVKAHTQIRMTAKLMNGYADLDSILPPPVADDSPERWTI